MLPSPDWIMGVARPPPSCAQYSFRGHSTTISRHATTMTGYVSIWVSLVKRRSQRQLLNTYDAYEMVKIPSYKSTIYRIEPNGRMSHCSNKTIPIRRRYKFYDAAGERPQMSFYANTESYPQNSSVQSQQFTENTNSKSPSDAVVQPPPKSNNTVVPPAQSVDELQMTEDHYRGDVCKPVPDFRLILSKILKSQVHNTRLPASAPYRCLISLLHGIC